MTDAVVTVVRCGKCRRSGDLTTHGDRFWCAWCQDWATVEVEQVRNALVERDAHEVRLVPSPPVAVPLQPLRIPTGWLVEYNNGLHEIDPLPELLPGDERYFLFKQDMLQLHHARHNRLLDVGWYPDGDLETGRYKLVVHEGDFRGPLLHEFQTRDRLTLVAEIERILQAVDRQEL
ncbi:MAG: hypothetical protein JNM56_24730 [Planctomycetia bacterium]|nr:hypothetical protein [Planctomycetia bacterium]